MEEESDFRTALEQLVKFSVEAVRSSTSPLPIASIDSSSSSWLEDGALFSSILLLSFSLGFVCCPRFSKCFAADFKTAFLNLGQTTNCVHVPRCCKRQRPAVR